MTVRDLFVLVSGNPLPLLVLAVVWPLWVLGAAAALRFMGAASTSQQVANLGIAVGVVAVTLQGMAVTYALTHFGVEPLIDTSVVLLAAPPWLLASGVVVEHLVHPGKQEAFRRPLRVGLQLVAVVVVLVAIFSVLRIHMLVFSGMLGFLGFVAVLIAVAWWMIRRLV
jgi:hypothetical protein